jgi:hypothetical protein
MSTMFISITNTLTSLTITFPKFTSIHIKLPNSHFKQEKLGLEMTALYRENEKFLIKKINAKLN